MSKSKYIALLLTSTLILGACSDDNDNPIEPPIIDPDMTAPTITVANDVVIDADSAANVIVVAVSDNLSVAGEITLEAVSSEQSLIQNNQLVFDGAELSITPEADLTGTAVISLTATDAAGNSASVDFNITVEAVDAPLTLLVREIFAQPGSAVPTLINAKNVIADSSNPAEFDDLLQ